MTSRHKAYDVSVSRKKRKKNKVRGIDCKVVMVGDASVGKTSLVLRYMHGEYQHTKSTIGASFVLKTWGIHDIAIWDTAGEEKYAGMTTFYYRNASAAILTFDMFDRASFYNLNERYIPILNNVGSAKLKVIVATKSDLLGTSIRRVSEEEGIELAIKSNPNVTFENGFVPYFETSAKTGHNVNETFEFIFNHFYPLGDESKKLNGFAADSIVLGNTPEKTWSRCCSS